MQIQRMHGAHGQENQSHRQTEEKVAPGCASASASASVSVSVSADSCMPIAGGRACTCVWTTLEDARAWADRARWHGRTCVRTHGTYPAGMF